MIDPISIYVGYRLAKAAYKGFTEEPTKPDKVCFTRDFEVYTEYSFDEAIGLVKTGQIPMTDHYFHEGMTEWKLVSESNVVKTINLEEEEIPEMKFPLSPTFDEAKVIEALRNNLRATADFHVWPNIPNEKLAGAKSTYLKLNEDEFLLALCDTTTFAKNAKDGFALTTKRIYWRNLWSDSKELEYAHLVG